jgi:hypothetical protein
MNRLVQRSILVLIVLCCFIAAKPKSNPLLVVDNTSTTVISSIPMSTSFNVSTSEKWKPFEDLEKLYASTGIETYVPRSLPTGFVLQKAEYRQGITKASYSNDQQSIIFSQKHVEGQQSRLEAWSTDEQQLIVIWSSAGIDFELRGQHVSKAQLLLFKQSLHPLTDQGIPFSFEVIETTEFSDLNGSKNRDFHIFTPDEFLGHIKKQSILLKESFSPQDNSIVIGLFSGIKSSSGYAIEVFDITLQNDQLIVSFRETEPAEGQIVLTYMTYPCQFIVVNIPPKKVAAVQFITQKGQAVASIPL